MALAYSMALKSRVYLMIPLTDHHALPTGLFGGCAEAIAAP